jgi:hypothetical protein
MKRWVSNDVVYSLLLLVLVSAGLAPGVVFISLTGEENGDNIGGGILLMGGIVLAVLAIRTVNSWRD